MRGQQFSRSSEAAHLVTEVNRLSVEENLETYGIEIDRLGLKESREFIFDTLYNKYFRTVREWALFTIEQDSLEDNFDDDYDSRDEEDY